MEPEKTPGIAPMVQNDVERIREMGRMIRQKRVAERLTLERAAEQSGVSAPTLSRLERQADMKNNRVKGFINPDTRTISHLTRWLGVSLDDMIEGATKTVAIVPRIVEGEVVVEGEISDASTPQIVKAYLRADRNLSPQAAANLAEMFDLAYRQYSQMSEPKQATGLPSSGDDGDQPSNTE